MAERYDRDLTDLFELQDVDRQSIADFEVDLSNNLYKLWNRLSAGSYFPPPVRRVDIPKAGGGTRPLGIPTVADRIAQEVAPVDRLVQGMPPSDRYRFRRDGSSVRRRGRSFWTGASGWSAANTRWYSDGVDSSSGMGINEIQPPADFPTPPKHRSAPTLKPKERPASKGRVRKGKTRS